MSNDFLVTADYAVLLDELKQRVGHGRTQAALAANHELILLYWDIGAALVARQAHAGWGAGVVHRLSADLRAAFPQMRGFSPRNLTYMQTFASAWPSREEFTQQAAARIPWGHIMVLLDKVDRVDRDFYAKRTLELGWSRGVLTVQIEARLHDRQGRALTNFEHALPPTTSDLARDALKDPYVFDFLAMGEPASERELEAALVDRVQRFLLELGTGFAFVGRQFPLNVGGDDFYIDLLFYHLKLRCFVVIELKAVPFRPEFAGKLHFYLTAVDRQLRHANDERTIGLLLCKDKNRVVVEYSLTDLGAPMGVASWSTARELPAPVSDALPSVEALERELTRTSRTTGS